jgi:translocation and assembly module TamB
MCCFTVRPAICESEIAHPPIRMQTEKKRVNYPRKIARILLKTVLFLFLFIVVLFLIVLTPPAQRFLTTKTENFLENKLKTKVEIGSISFGLSGNINLSDVYFEDRTRDTLLSGGTIKANLNFIKLFSNEVVVKDIELQNITAKIKRILPDTVFNFQYIVDAFATTPAADTTTTTAPMKLSINDVTLDNVNVHLNDAITGNNMFVHIGNMSATIDSLDLTTQHYHIPSVILRNTQARIKQTKPLVTPEPIAKDMAEAAAPSPMKLDIGIVDLTNVDLDYSNDVSAFYTTLDLGKLRVDGKDLDLQNQKIHLDEIVLNKSSSIIRLGKKEAAKVVAKEIEQEVEVQAQKGWEFRVDRLRIDNNTFQFDNDNTPKAAYGMDYAHMRADSFNLHVDNFVLNTDSVFARILKGSFRERSGFVLNELRSDLLYANNQAYLKDLYLKTPGTELKRYALLEYSSYEALAENFEKTLLDVEIVNSYVQVKDILTFAPQLRTQPAFRNPADIWQIHLVGNGTMARLNFESIQFNGFENTQLNAEGVLAGLTDPNQAGGTFTIYRLHTTKNDLALFGGDALNKQINLPASIDINGQLSGNMNNLQTALNINTSLGNAAVKGRFTNITNPASATYNANIRTTGLQLGTLLRQKDFGSVTSNVTVNGSGFTPETMNTKFNGVVSNFGYNRYNYRNVRLNGSLNKTVFDVDVDSRDPNAFLTASISGNVAENMSLRINANVDSLKTLPLGFTPDPMVFHGKIVGNIPNINPDFLEADVLISDGILVSKGERLPLDSVHFTAGRAAEGQFMRLRSNIVNGEIVGQYRLADLGTVIQHNIQPYFSVTPYTKTNINIAPYDFRFIADVTYHPVLATFVPGLQNAENLHAEGRLATGEGLQATATTSLLQFNNNLITDLNATVRTSDSGMIINSNVAHLVSGSFDVYNVSLNARALNNRINFILGIDDKAGNDKYTLGGLITQPSAGDIVLQLDPNNLLLNYERWTTSADNSIGLINNQIDANNFVLQKGDQRLTLQSTDGNGFPLNVQFTNFRIGTITGFMQSDTALIDGVTNGSVTLLNVMTQPVFTSNLTVTDLSFRQDTLGNLAAKVNSSGSRYETDVRLTGRGNDLSVTGSFAPQGSTDVALDLDLNIRRMELNTFEGAMATFVKSASGSINGNVAINGTASNPDVDGRINFDSTTVSTLFLGGPLTINNETLVVSNDGFRFDQFSIRDSANNRLTIDGNVLTSNFINYNFDLDVRARNFRALNTTAKDNKIYYGQLYLTTNLHVGGTEKAPAVDGSLRIVEGTNFNVVIPQAEPGVVQREGIVEFVDFEAPGIDTLFRQYDSLNNAGITGFDVNVNIEIEKEAITNIIVDVANGDFVNLQGEATLTAGIDPSGKVTLTGPYEIENGAYQFSMNFLQRRFTIKKGSRIVWLGEPTNAELNVTAIYEANIQPLDLVADRLETQQRNYYLQKLPFQVSLSMTGELMKPTLSFDIALPEDRTYAVSGEVEQTVRTRLNQLRQEPSELNKQVFAVLLLNRFVGENPFQSEAGGGGFDAKTFARQSVSKLMTEQLNELAAGLIDGVDINFDIASTDDYTTGEKRTRTDLNVGLSKRLLNDRLTVTVGSNFLLEGQQPGNQQSNNIAGNVSVNYQLSQDGRYMLRFYRRNEYEGLVDGYVLETGMSFLISVDYDRFGEVLRARRIKREERRKTRERTEQQNVQKNEGTQAP